MTRIIVHVAVLLLLMCSTDAVAGYFDWLPRPSSLLKVTDLLPEPSQVRESNSSGDVAEKHFPDQALQLHQLERSDSSEKSTDPIAMLLPDVNRIEVCRQETLCKLRYKDGAVQRARIRDLIAPIHFNAAEIDIPAAWLQQLDEIYQRLLLRNNLRIKFIVTVGGAPLTALEQKVYGDHRGLARALARRAVVTVEQALALPADVAESAGQIFADPSSVYSSALDPSLSGRLEVEFWYDDPLMALPQEPQLCPEEDGAQTITRVYQSPYGTLESVLYKDGQPSYSPAAIAGWRRALDAISDRTNPRLRFTGYLSNDRLDRRTAAIYKDDIGLSMARARRAMEAVSADLELASELVEFDGRGYVQSDDVVGQGFVEADYSHVVVEAVYDDLAVIDDYDGIEITRLTRAVTPRNPFDLNLMRISVDGKPVDDPGKSLADLQRCTDVALDLVDIRFKYDSLKPQRRLNISAWPRSVRYADVPETDFFENRIDFQLYSNYRNYYQSAEVRVFGVEQSLQDEPLATLALDSDGRGHWLADFPDYHAPGRKLKFVVRVVDADGRFDETLPQELWVVDQIKASAVFAKRSAELLSGYGESRLAVSHIPVAGGTIHASGRSIPGGHSVYLAGHSVPVDAQGQFVAEEIIPHGLHTAEVAVLDAQGNGELYLRDLQLKDRDWFTVGIADLTLSSNKTDGPADLLDPDQQRYSEDFSIEGRLAFYSRGQLDNGWSLTASADTREGPVDEIFSNFLDKTSDSQLRRMDPDRHYPTLGDDSTVVEDAPTRGKFYLRLDRDEHYGLIGNYKTSYRDNEIAMIERELYGVKGRYQPGKTTSFGAEKVEVDAFIADPGTISGRDELRGSGGSLYYLNAQDILEGSEDLRIEIRDKDSGLVLASEDLSADLDYDIDYIQGRILLTDVLPTVASSDLISSDAMISGNPVYLVAYYEYTPDFSDPDTFVSGGRAHYWFNDYLKVGVQAAFSEEADVDSQLGGLDLTLRKSAATWLKLELGQSEGSGVLTSSSSDGGYSYSSDDEVSDDSSASAYRLEGALSFADIRAGWRGQARFYLQDVEGGYGAPGLESDNNVTQYGADITLPLFERWKTRLKYDTKEDENSLETTSAELDVRWQMNDRWALSSGVRNDSRTELGSETSSTQEEGDLTDAVVRVDYNSKGSWNAWSWLQGTVRATDEREDNNRAGVGASWRLSERFRLNGELSGGDLGNAASLGSEFLYSDRTTVYSSYTLENERSDNGVLARKGNMASGFRTRYSDVTSIYMEEKYTHGDTPTGLVHTAGVDLTPTENLNFSANLDLGTLKDPETAAELERTAAAFSVGYGLKRLSLASGLEYRVDNTEQSDGSYNERTTWLFKNSFKFQLNDNGRLLGKLNMSISESSLGSSYDGDYTEAVLGYAYRPVAHDRLNMLFKYTYFDNVPATDDDSISDTTLMQRSHIAAVDVMYDLTPRWTVGGKYAYRLAQVALDREDPEYFDSRAQLMVARVDWHLMHRWDALVEARMLDLPDAQDQRSGALVALYRHFGNHVKAGVGYNFSDFSDDLTDLDYRHQGLFFNIIGKF